MQINKKYEILEYLPAYGPMYFSFTDNTNEPFVSEGFVVRFFKSDGTDWVANFNPGWTECVFIKGYTDSESIIVIANGTGYLIDCENKKLIKILGFSINNILEIDDDFFLISDDTGVQIINDKGIYWESPRISFDGIKDIKINNNILTGLSYDPMCDFDDWSKFKINLITKEIEGGSYRKYYTDENKQKKLKPWWKIWN